MAKPVRIQKYLSDSGILSRRKTEEYIRAGRITVNGRRAEPGCPVTPADAIAIDGRRIHAAEKKEPLYLMLNKPRGYVTTTSDELGRRCVTQLVEELDTRVYPVGRLDKDSEGLLLMTNDGQFANLIMHPSHHITKTYRVTLRPGITEDQCVALAAGVDIGTPDRPEPTAPATVLVLEKYPDRAVVQITIAQGKNRQVRRMCEALGLTVARLKRTAVGPLRLGMLPPGRWRELKKSEVIALRSAGGGAPARPEPAAPAPKPDAPQKRPAARQDSRRSAPPKQRPAAQGPDRHSGPGDKKAGGPSRQDPRHPAPKKPRRAPSDGITRDPSGALRFRDKEDRRPRRPAGGAPRKGGAGR